MRRFGRFMTATIAVALLTTVPVAAGAQSDVALDADLDATVCDDATFTELGAVLPYLGFEMDFESATLDPDSGRLKLDLLITNATGRGDLQGNGLGMQYIEWQGAVYPADFSAWLSMPADLPVRASMDAGPFPDDFSLCDATLHFGRPTEHQSVLPLVEGAAAVFPAPREMQFDKKKHTRNKKKLAQATLRQATVYPANCTAGGWGDAADADVAGILLSVDQKLKKTGFYNSATLVDPSGEEWSASNSSDWVSETGKRPRQFCFNVASPVGGKYKLRLEYGDGGIQIPFQLPPVDFYDAAAATDEAEVDAEGQDEEPVADSDADADTNGSDAEGEPSGISA